VQNIKQTRSLWAFSAGFGCCAVELFATKAGIFDIESAGAAWCDEIENADVMVVSGCINAKFAPILRNLYERMQEPKFVICFGNCANGGALASVSCAKADDIVPVDVYVHGCPPRPETLRAAFDALCEHKNENAHELT